MNKELYNIIEKEKLDIVSESIEKAHGLPNECYSNGEYLQIERRKILEKRSDDDTNTILKRYDIYMKETKPVLDFYSSKKGFYEIDGSLNIEQITNKIEDILKV